MLKYLIIALITLYVVSLAYLWWRIYKRRYTREKYAFTYLYSFISFGIILYGYLFEIDTFLSVLNYMLVELCGLPEMTIPEASWFDKILASILFITLATFCYKMFVKWNGPISERESSQKGHLSINIFSVGCKVVYKESRIIYNEQKEQDNGEDTVSDYKQMVVENLPWYKQTAELLTIINSQIKINVEKDWYSDLECFISSYGKNNQPICIGCFINDISTESLKMLVHSVLKQEKNKKIEFQLSIKNFDGKEERMVDGHKIIVYGEKYLLDNLIKLDDYIDRIKKEYERDEFYQGSEHSVSEIYTEPPCAIRNIQNKKLKGISSIENHINDWLYDNSKNHQIALLGEYGQGKSVFCLHLAYTLLTQKKIDRIPVIINLKGKYPAQYADSKKLLNEWSDDNGFNIKAVLKLFIAGRLLLIFDGFDEMMLVGDAKIRRQHFRKLWEFNIPYSKMLITGRPNYFIDDKEMKSLLRIGQYCEEVELRSFDRYSISNALRYLDDETRKDILDEYDNGNNHSFKDLLQRPSLLAITGLMWGEISAMGDKNLNSASVIDLYLKKCYRRQEEKHSDGEECVLSESERAYFMQGIALGMVQQNGYTNLITYNDLERIILSLLENMPQEVSEADVNSHKEKIQERYSKEYNNATIISDIRSCGVLVRELTTSDGYKFAHKSFLELLVAQYFVTDAIKNSLDDDDLEVKKINAFTESLKLKEKSLKVTSDINRFLIEGVVNKVKDKVDYYESDLNQIYNMIKKNSLSLRVACKIYNINEYSLLFSSMFQIVFILILTCLSCFGFFDFDLTTFPLSIKVVGIAYFVSLVGIATLSSAKMISSSLSRGVFFKKELVIPVTIDDYTKMGKSSFEDMRNRGERNYKLHSIIYEDSPLLYSHDKYDNIFLRKVLVYDSDGADVLISNTFLQIPLFYAICCKLGVKDILDYYLSIRSRAKLNSILNEYL